MDLVKLGMADHEDVQIICCSILSDLCAANFAAVSGRIKDLIDVFEKAIERSLKMANSKSQGNRVMDNLRLYARTLRTVNGHVEEDKTSPFHEFLGRFLKDDLFRTLYESFATNRFEY